MNELMNELMNDIKLNTDFVDVILFSTGLIICICGIITTSIFKYDFIIIGLIAIGFSYLSYLFNRIENLIKGRRTK